ncbi:MAG: hypothetical protein ABWW69_04430 [Pyrodictiaceae archaeon]
MQIRLHPRIIHDNVSFLEVRRGEGIEGGDRIIVATSLTSNKKDIIYFPPGEIQLHTYDLRLRIHEIMLGEGLQLEDNGADDTKMIRITPKGKCSKIAIELYVDGAKASLRASCIEA